MFPAYQQRTARFRVSLMMIMGNISGSYTLSGH